VDPANELLLIKYLSVKMVEGERNQRYLQNLVSRIPVIGRPFFGGM